MSPRLPLYVNGMLARPRHHKRPSLFTLRLIETKRKFGTVCSGAVYTRFSRPAFGLFIVALSDDY